MAIFAALMAVTVGTRAAVNIAVNANTTVSNILWTASNLNGNPPTVTGTPNPLATGVFAATGQLATNAGFSLTFTAAKNWNAANAQSEISGGTFASYIAGLTPCRFSSASTALGVNSGAGDLNSSNRFDVVGEVMFIKLGTTNISQSLILKSFSWTLATANDRADVLIYDASANAVTAVQWDTKPDSMPTGTWALENGDVMVVAIGASNGANDFRWKSLTLDIPASSGIAPPTALSAVPADALVKLNWNVDTSGSLAYYNVYRSTTSGSGYAPIATGVTTNTHTDLAVTNGTTYYYVATAVDTSAFETAYSLEASATPTTDLVIVDLNNNRQADARSATNSTGTFQAFGSSTLLGKVTVGQYLASMSRSVLKFPLQLSSLGSHTTNDIQKAVLRMYMTSNTLGASGDGSVIEVFNSLTVPVNSAVSSNHFQDVTFTKTADWSSITSASSPGQWYEVDVTAAVLADLAQGETGTSAGTAFRLQLNNDIQILASNAIRRVEFVDNFETIPPAASRIPQLRIKWKSGLTPYDAWAALWLPANVSSPASDNDADGLNNLYEYGLNGNPINGTQAPAALPTFTKTGESFIYVHPKRSDDANLVYTVETTTDLVFGSWTSTGYTVGGTDVTGGTLNYVTNTVDTVEDQKFIRLKIEQN
jgi:hypothetical protein